MPIGADDEDTATDLELLPPSKSTNRQRPRRRSNFKLGSGIGHPFGSTPRQYSVERLFGNTDRTRLPRAQSSPSQLVIRDADLLQKVKDTLTAAFCSTPVRLEDRRKYAPLTPGN